MSRFKKATRKQARLRMALDGPPGSGKSYTALRMAFAFAADNPDLRVACVEAGENGGLSLYQGDAPDGVPFDFDILEIVGDYSPDKYTSAINEAGREKYDVLLIDSLSHAWSGTGGALDIKDRQAGNDFTKWKNVTPMHNRLIDSILQSPCHVIATMRSKTEYVLETTTDAVGHTRTVPRKVGTAPIQRAGMEYEFTIYASIDSAHVLTVTKSRCKAVQDLIVHKPGAEFMAPVIEWLYTGEAGEAPPEWRPASAEELGGLRAELAATGWPEDAVLRGVRKHGAESMERLTSAQAAAFRAVAEEWNAARKRKSAESGAASAPAGSE